MFVFSCKSYLHTANIYRQDCCEEKHLQKKVRNEPHDSEKTKLLHKTKICLHHFIFLKFILFFFKQIHLVSHDAMIKANFSNLDSWHQSEISNQDDAQLSGHVLHDRPALITKA